VPQCPDLERELDRSDESRGGAGSLPKQLIGAREVVVARDLAALPDALAHALHSITFQSVSSLRYPRPVAAADHALIGITLPPHSLSRGGKLGGYRSSRLNLQWRVIYRIEADVVTVHVEKITPHMYRRK
jgi:hypothetical protein